MSANLSRIWRPGDAAIVAATFDLPRWRNRPVAVERWAESATPALLCSAADDPGDKVYVAPLSLRVRPTREAR